MEAEEETDEDFTGSDKEDDEDAPPASKTFNREKHIKFFKHCLTMLPQMYQSIDSSRLTVLYFSLSGLDILGALDEVVSDKEKQFIIQWIYRLQVTPATKEDIGVSRCGFYATDSLPSDIDENYGHVAMTYVALCCLLILGDDLSGIDRDSIMGGLKALQLENGSYQCVSFGTESDARFVYCAACISYLLNDWRGMDRKSATQFLFNSQSYEGGFAQNIGREGHGGSTFCSLAALSLMGTLEELPQQQRDTLTSWCLRRQTSGFNGRPNKAVDTCYSFWVGASLKLIGAEQWIHKELNHGFLMTTQDVVMGGFSKWPGHLPDVLHSYFGLAGLALVDEPGTNPIQPAVNITTRAYKHWQSLNL